MKIKKMAVSLLLAACTFGCVACKGKGNSGNKAPAAGETVTEPTTITKVEGTLHDVTVDYSAPVDNFVTNGQTKYKIILGDNSRGKAAGAVMEHVYKSTGASIPATELKEIATYNEETKKYTLEIGADDRYIFVGCEELYQDNGGVMPDYETVGIAGYKIETIGKNVFINAYSLHGWQMGVIAFLRATLGYDMLAEDCVIYEKDGSVMPKMNIVERPDFDFRQPNGTSVSDMEKFGMGYTYSDPIIYTGESSMHNVYDFVSLEEMDENPDWASSDVTRWQLCYNSRGNQETYKKFIQHIADKIIGFLKKYPDKNTICIGQHDIGGNTPMVQNCKCKACTASYEYYGTYGAGWLSLCNRASLLVDEWLATDEAIEYFGGEKDWNLLQLVYHTQVNPPIEKDQNGYKYDENGRGIPLEEKWFDSEGNMYDWDEVWLAEDNEYAEEGVIRAWSEAQDRIVAAPNVHYWYATSAADWTHSYLDAENAGWKNICDGWAGVNCGNGGGEFYVWAYALNSQYILYPYNTFDTAWETTRFFKNLGAKYMFWQGQYQNKNNAGFTKLRNYLDSKVEFDVNADYQFYVDKFFKNYYGVGGEYVQEMFEQVVAQSRYNELVNNLSGNIHNPKLGDAINWPEGLVHTWMGLLEKAYDAVEQEYKVSNPEQYEIYKKHITIEEQFPLQILCTTYADSYDANDLKELRKGFLEKFYGLGNVIHAEGRLMTEITDAWDLD